MPDPVRIVVTGAAGFVGSELARDLAARGLEVVALSRRPPPAAPGVRFVRYALEEPLPADVLTGARAVVHCAYARADVALNVAAAERLLCAARAAGVRRSVFLSSLAAREGAASAYARQKLAVERLFEAEGGTVIRAGLVLGAGGLFASMHEHVRAGKPIPILSGGRQPIQVVGVGDLVRAVATVIERDLAGLFVVAHPEAIPYRGFYAALAAHAGATPRFVPVPFHLLNAALRLAEVLGVRLPIQRDSLLGLRAMARVEPGPHLARLGLAPKGFAELLEELPR